MTKRIVALAGDGIGPEIMESALAVLKAATQSTDFDYEVENELFGGAAIDATGTPLPSETLTACKQADAILLAAIGGPRWTQAEQTPEKGLLALRKALQLYANIRPIKVADSLIHLSPLKPEIVSGTDFVVVRELTSGIYFGEPRAKEVQQAYDTNRYTVEEIDRIMHQAFVIARGRKKQVTSVDKANVLATSQLWREVAERVAKEYPDITLEHQYVDSAAMKLVTNPTAFDVIVTENLFGDILSDEGSVLPGTLGVLPSASHSVAGASLYEPIHGSAPDIAGKNCANPVSMVLSVAMMMHQSFQEEGIAKRIEDACYSTMEKGILTPDLGGKATTQQMTQAIIDEVSNVATIA